MSEGVAIIISTPNEFVEDLLENNEAKFKDRTISVVKGNIYNYVKNEPNGVSQTLFGKDKPKEQAKKTDGVSKTNIKKK